MGRANINGHCTVHNNEKCDLPAASAVFSRYRGLQRLSCCK